MGRSNEDGNCEDSGDAIAEAGRDANPVNRNDQDTLSKCSNEHHLDGQGVVDRCGETGGFGVSIEVYGDLWRYFS